MDTVAIDRTKGSRKVFLCPYELAAEIDAWRSAQRPIPSESAPSWFGRRCGGGASNRRGGEAMTKIIPLIGAVALLGACAAQQPPIQTYRPPLGADCTIRGVPCTPEQRARIGARAKAKPKTAVVARNKPKAAPVADPIDDAMAAQRRRSLEMVEMMSAPIGSEEFSTALALDSVRRLLKDPSSAEFSNVRTVDYKSGKLVCGQVNAKNSFGGYVGAKPFVAGTVGAFIYISAPSYPELELATNTGLMDACY